QSQVTDVGLVAAILLPDEVERRAGPPFPAQDRVPAQRAEVEVRVAERLRRRSAGLPVRVDRVPAVLQPDRADVLAVHESVAAPGRGEFLEVQVLPCRDVRLRE